MQHLDLMELIPLSEFRAALAREDAIFVLSENLETILWGNAAAAQLLGIDNIANIAGSDAQFTMQTRRQIAALELQDDAAHKIMLRLAGGLQQRLLPYTISRLIIPAAEKPALLMTTPVTAQDETPPALPCYHMAKIGIDGTIISTDAEFAALDVNRNTIADLIIEVQNEQEGFIQRRVRAGQTTIPAAMIRLNRQDEKAAYLFIAEKTTLPASIEQANSEDKSALAAELPPANGAKTPAIAPQTRQTTIQATAQEPAENAAQAHFVWQVDAQGRFSEISPELANIVGKHMADILGKKFSDVAENLGFDDDGAISALLEKQETWSGKRVFWPVEGTNQRIAVDLAALPIFSRDRTFSGFSGFGVIYPELIQTDPDKTVQDKTVQAKTEPDAAGSPLLQNISEADKPADAENAQPDSNRKAPEKPLTSERIILMEALRASQTRGHNSAAPAEQNSKPAPAAEIHPARPASGLSQTERNAFREIAERLRREVLQKAPTSNTSEDNSQIAQAATADDTGIEHTKAAPVNGRQVPEKKTEDIPYPHDMPPANHNQTSQTGAQNGDIAASLPSARQDEEDLHVLSGLPVPVLIHNADRLHFANQAFFDMTGYTSLDDLRHAGGIDALFAQPDDSNINGMILCLADGGHKVVEAHLQSVPWQGNRALMLSLLPERILQADNDDHAGQTKSRPAFLSAVKTENPVHQLQTELALHAPEDETDNEGDDSAAKSRNENAPQMVENKTADQPMQPDFQALQTQIDELTSILDTATDGVVIIGQDGKIRSLNQSAAALFGYDINELTGKSFAVLFAIESQRAAIDYIHGLSGDGVASLLNDGREVIGREAQGRFIPLFMTIGKLPASKGYCAVMRDITQWKRAEEELTSARQEAERASSHKTEFLARISHEIRTPLNAIIGFSELMAEEKFGPIGNERYREYLRDIHRSGNHVLALVNDLLDISKIEAGALDLEFEAVALNDALAEAVALMQPQANRERVIIRSSFSAVLPDIVADARSIRQVALNLLSNAIRFTGQGGQVIVSTSYEADGNVVMRVRDTGIGMSQSELEQALKPFRQVSHHNVQSHYDADIRDWRQQGTGLGLPLTKAMVEANRAQFVIESSPGQGTTAEIIFPPTRVLAS